MAFNAGDIIVNIKADLSGFERALGQVSSRLNILSSANVSASQTFAKTLGITAAALGTVGFFGMKAAGDLETARQGFVTLLGSAKDADEIIAKIKKDAASTPFELSGLIQANQALTAVTKNGMRSEDVLLNVGKALAASGKGQAELDRIIANLQQIGLTGKITEMDVRQFGMSGINILELLADYYGVTTAEAGEMVKDSKDAFGDLEKAFAKAGNAGGKFSRSFIEQSGTWNQLVSNVKDTMWIWAGDLVKNTGLFDAMKKALASALGWLADNKERILGAITATFGWLKDNLPIVIGIIIGGLLPALGALFAPIITMIGTLWPFMLALVGISIAVNALIKHFGGLQGTLQALQPIINLLSSVWNNVLKPPLEALWNLIKTQLIPAFKDLWTQISPILIPVWKALAAISGGILLTAILAVIAVLYALIWVVTKIINAFVWYNDQLKRNSDASKAFWESVGQNIIGAFNWVMDKIREVISWFYNLRNSLSDALSGAGEAIKAPFRSAFDWIKDKIGGVKDALSNLNPFQRHSPSLVDMVKLGTTEIKDLYGSMFSEIGTMSVDAKPQLNQIAMEPAQVQPIQNRTVQVNINPGIMVATPQEARTLSEMVYDNINQIKRANGEALI